jgi:hypothetical protein
MISLEASTWSDRCYGALLSFYPVEFRVRFRREMVQIFRDCSRYAARERGPVGLFGFWLRTLADLSLSIPRERVRVLIRAGGGAILTGGLVDSFVIGAIIGFHLLVGGTGIAAYISRHSNEADFLILSALSGGALGAVGVLCSRIQARYRRTTYRLIELQ